DTCVMAKPCWAGTRHHPGPPTTMVSAGFLLLDNEVTVPGSTANLGGGFDTLGVAVQLYLRARIVDCRQDGGARLEVVRSKPAPRGINAVERAFAVMAKQASGSV